MKNNKQPDLSIIIVSFNCRSELQQCLESVQQCCSHINAEIIVIDNNSDDGSPAMVERDFPSVTLLRNQQNLGYSKANNQGIRKSRSEQVLFLNPDTLVNSAALATLLQGLRAHKNIGCVGPALLQGGRDFQVSFGGKRDFCREMLQKFCLNPYFRLRLRFMKKNRRVLWLSGACLLARKDALEDVGGFDEAFFLYYEDIDLGIRIFRSGRKLLFLPCARIFHAGGRSTQKQGLNSRYFYRQSQLYFYRKHNSRVSQALLRIFLLLNFSFMLLGGIISGKKDLAERKRFYHLLRKI